MKKNNLERDGEAASGDMNSCPTCGIEVRSTDFCWIYNVSIQVMKEYVEKGRKWVSRIRTLL